MKHFYDITEQRRNGLNVVAPGIQVTVFLQGTQTLAVLYSDDGITQTLTPGTVFSDTNGRFDFYVANGRYDLLYSGPGFNSFTQLNVEITDATDVTALGKTPIAFTADNTHSGSETFSNALGVPNAAVNPAACSIGMVYFNTANTTWNICTAPNVWTVIQSTLATGTPNSFSALQTFAAGLNADSNARFKGPNPYVDITAFGARAVNPNGGPAVPGITANCTNSQNTVALSNASSFQNGDGVTIYGCGAPHSMTTPSAPTVTPSVSVVGTNTFVDANATAGSTTYNYKIVARDRAQGLTAASAAGSTATGQTLGAITANISTLTRSGTTVTVVTSAAHALPVGCSGLGNSACPGVFIGGGNGLSDVTFRGWFPIASVADTTHFTFNGPPNTTLGASASATGGTFTYYSLNHVTWASVTGAIQYYIYSDRANPGTYALVGVSNPTTTSTPDLQWDDFGSPMMDGLVVPPFVPSAPPGSATSDSLTTTITSGAGTTTLTLASAAGTTISGQTILFDNGPAFIAASQFAPQSSVMIPAVTSGTFFVINSWTLLPSQANQVFQQGSLYLNEPIEIPSNGGGGNKWIGDVFPQSGGGAPGFAWASHPAVYVNAAHPGLFFSAAAAFQFSLKIQGLSMSAVPGNNSILMMVDGGFQQNIDEINFSSGSGNGDYMSIGLYLRGSPLQNNSNVVMDKLTFLPGGGSDGVSWTPSLYCRLCGTTALTNSNNGHRGFQFEGSTFEVGIGGVVYFNGGGTPFITSRGGNIVLGTSIADTIAQPVVAGFNGSTGLTGNVFLLNGVTSPSSGVLPFSGIFTSISGGNNSTFATSKNDFLPVGTNPQTYLSQLNSNQAFGPSNSTFIRFGGPMAAPTCAVSAGGTVGIASYQFTIAPVWGVNMVDTPSALSTSCAATSGNQTVTVSWTPPAGNPVGYSVYMLVNGVGSPLLVRQTTGVGSGCAQPFIAGGGTSSWVINTGLISCGVSPLLQPQGGPTMLMPGVQGIAAPNVITPQFSMAATVFASIGTPANGTILYCSDCTIANPCAGAGTGALAKRLNGIWVCN